MALPKKDWRVEWDNRKSAFVERTWLAMMRDPAQRRLYFYYRRTDGIAWGEFYAVADGDEPPAGAELVVPEHIPAGTQALIRFWIDRYVGQLPMIPGVL